MLEPGDIAPEFTLETADSRPISLPRVLKEGHPVLLVFLRHLG